MVEQSELQRMRLTSLQIGKPKTILPGGSGEWWDKEWISGIFKEPCSHPVWLGYQGIEGDGVADTRVHGGADKAVCVYPGEHYPAWRGELSSSNLAYGAFGENFTVSRLLEDQVCVGDVYSLGEARVQVSQPREPCWKPSRRWKVQDLAARILHTGRTGFYFRVLRHGCVEAGQDFKLEERPHSQWSVARCNGILHHHQEGLEGAAALAGCPPLSASWKDSLLGRVRQQSLKTN
jgi:MOSC domain-containing protein YiiM